MTFALHIYENLTWLSRGSARSSLPVWPLVTPWNAKPTRRQRKSTYYTVYRWLTVTYIYLTIKWEGRQVLPLQRVRVCVCVCGWMHVRFHYILQGWWVDGCARRWQSGPLWGSCCLVGYNPETPSLRRPEGRLCNLRRVHIDRRKELSRGKIANRGPISTAVGPLWCWRYPWDYALQCMYYKGGVAVSQTQGKRNKSLDSEDEKSYLVIC